MANHEPHAHKVIAVRGAREHNLKDVDLDLRRDRLMVVSPSASAAQGAPGCQPHVDTLPSALSA